MLSEKIMDKLEKILDDLKKDKTMHEKISEYINENIDKDIENERVNWEKVITSFFNPIAEFVNTLDKASTQIAILNGLVCILDRHKMEIMHRLEERFKNDE